MPQSKQTGSTVYHCNGLLRMEFPLLLQRSLRSTTEEISTTLGVIEAWCEDNDVDLQVSMHLGLMLDEWLTNVAEHAYAGNEGEIQIELHAVSGANVEVVVRDCGVPFDPTEMAEPDLTLGIEDREIGGLGIHLIRRMASHLSYERRDGANELRFAKMRAVQSADPLAADAGD